MLQIDDQDEPELTAEPGPSELSSQEAKPSVLKPRRAHWHDSVATDPTAAIARSSPHPHRQQPAHQPGPFQLTGSPSPLPLTNSIFSSNQPPLHPSQSQIGQHHSQQSRSFSAFDFSFHPSTSPSASPQFDSIAFTQVLPQFSSLHDSSTTHSASTTYSFFDPRSPSIARFSPLGGRGTTSSSLSTAMSSHANQLSTVQSLFKRGLINDAEKSVLKTLIIRDDADAKELLDTVAESSDSPHVTSDSSSHPHQSQQQQQQSQAVEGLRELINEVIIELK